MIYRILLSCIFVSSAIGCKSTGPGVLSKAYDQGPPGLTRACSNGIRAACAMSGAAAVPERRLSVLQGLTSNERARFSVVVPGDERLRYFVRGPEGVREVLAIRRFGPGSDWAVDQLDVDRLKIDVDYDFVIAGANGTLWDLRTFRALDTKKSHARVAVIGATDDAKTTEAKAMWPTVLAQNVDAILLIGDNVYVDRGPSARAGIKTDPATLWRRYVETRRALPFYFAVRLVPTLATWDDHDFAYNDADASYVYRDQSRDTFLTFFPQNAPGAEFTRGPGIASWWNAFGVAIGLTDNRSFRSVNRAAGEQTHFGAEQEAWLAQRLREAERPIFLVSGDQFFGGYHPFESYEGCHPESFLKQIEVWRSSAKMPIVFVSGDRLLSEIIAIPAATFGYPTFELTSSGLHAGTFGDALKAHPSPHQVVGVAGQANFTVVEFMRTENNLVRFSVQAFGRNRELLYQRTLAVKR